MNVIITVVMIVTKLYKVQTYNFTSIEMYKLIKNTR